MKFFAFTVFAIFGAMLRPSEAISCDKPDELESCVFKSAFMLNRDIELPSNVDQMKEHCSNAKESIGCLMEFNDQCVKPPPQISMRRIYGMVQRGLNGRCGSDEKLQEFVDQIKCLREDNRIELVRQCSDKHIKHLEMIVDIAPMQRVGPLCCAFQNYRSCVKQVINKECGDSVSEYFENMLNEYRDELLTAMCDKFSNNDLCAQNLPADVWTPMKEVIDKTDKIEHNYKTTVPVMFKLLDSYIKKA